MRLQLITALALSLIAADAFAERPANIDTTRTDSISLAYRLARGDSHNHVFTAQMETEGLEGPSSQRSAVRLNIPVTYEVQSVDGAGTALVATSLRTPEVSFSVNGQAQSATALANTFRSARLTQSVARDGTIVERTGRFAATTPSEAFVTGFVSDSLAVHWVQFPQEAVNIGDSWLQIIPMDMHDAENNLSATVSVRYTLSGFASSGTGEVAVIDAQYTTAIDGQMIGDSGRSVRVVGRGHGEGYLLFDYREGRIHELGLQNGVVITATENNGQRSVTAFSSNAEFRAQVVAAAPAAVPGGR